MRSAARLSMVVMGALILQRSLLVHVRLADVGPDLLLLVAVSAGIVGGPERGAVAGFAAGLVADLFVQTPLGLSALAFGLVGYGVGTLQASVIRLAWWIPILTGLAASAAGIVAYAVLGAILGQPQFVRPHLVVLAGGVGLMNAALVPVAVRALDWALATESDAAYAR
ncbi:MAG: rod shape-determining protein MreD [Acidimicrobiales bacterium]